jgi:16S rRNA (cytidine1402-2'-O)-methyltransferase
LRLQLQLGHKHRVSDANRPEPLPPGLYIVATPIGNLGDVTMRAVEVLARCDGIACEDTGSRPSCCGISGFPSRCGATTITARERDRARLLEAMRAGGGAGQRRGTPLVSDPGYRLVREARAAGIAVTSLPGRARRSWR